MAELKIKTVAQKTRILSKPNEYLRNTIQVTDFILTMLGREKPFEVLSSKEKEAFKLASEILEWSVDPDILRRYGVIELREEATKLFELASNMDTEHSDEYYKVHELVDSLRQKYKTIREGFEWRLKNFQEAKFIFDPAKDSAEDLTAIAESSFSRGTLEVEFLHWNATPQQSPGYGDYVAIDIWDWSSMKSQYPDLPESGLGLRISELFDYVRYKEPHFKILIKVLEDKYGKNFQEIGRRGAHLHDFGGEQLDVRINYKNMKELTEDLKIVLDMIKKNPRALKDK